LVGSSGVTVRAVLHRWNVPGPGGLADAAAEPGKKDEVLAAFATHADPGRRKVLVLVDNARWHTAKRLPVPANVRLATTLRKLLHPRPRVTNSTGELDGEDRCNRPPGGVTSAAGVAAPAPGVLLGTVGSIASAERRRLS
jgi:hypothetical protein